MLTYPLDGRGDLPVYDYLYRCIRGDILRGELRAGARLPSKRALARQLGVSVATVENAYGQLIAEGFVEARQRRGYFVGAVEQTPPPSVPGRKAAEETPPPPAWFLDLRTNSVEEARFPFSTWSKLMRQVLSEEKGDLLRASDSNGVLPLRRAIAAYLRESRGIAARPEQIVVGAGTEYLYQLIVQLLGRRQVYGVEDPGYGKVGRIYGVNEVAVRTIGVDRSGPDVEELRRSDVTVLHCSPSHHFPSGVVTTVGRRQALLRWSEEGEERYLVEDDYDSEFRFSGRPIPAMQTLDRSGRVIYVNTFSKTLAPSFRISFFVLPEALMECYHQKLGFYACTVPSFEQYTLARFIEGGYLERHINRMKTFYRAKRDEVISAIRQSPLGERAAIMEAEAGLHFLLELDTRVPDETLQRRAAEAGIRLSCLSGYVHGNHPAPQHRVVVNYSGLDLNRLRPALERLAAIM